MPSKCGSSGTADPCSASFNDLPPRGIIKSISSRLRFITWITSRSGSRIKVAASGIKPRILQSARDQSRQESVAAERLAATSQHHRVARLERQRSRIDSDVGARFVNHRDHANRHPDLFDLEPVRPRPFLDRMCRPDRRAPRLAARPRPSPRFACRRASAVRRTLRRVPLLRARSRSIAFARIISARESRIAARQPSQKIILLCRRRERYRRRSRPRPLECRDCVSLDSHLIPLFIVRQVCYH